MKKTYTAQNIQFLRNGINLPIEKIAALTGITKDAMKGYEEHGYTPTHRLQRPADLTRLCNYFNVYVDDVIYCNLKKPGNINPSTFTGLAFEIAGVKNFKRQSQLNINKYSNGISTNTLPYPGRRNDFEINMERT